LPVAIKNITFTQYLKTRYCFFTDGFFDEFKNDFSSKDIEA